MPYSAVIQPWPLPRRNGGTLSSTEAVTSTRVSPKLTRHDPSACTVKPGSKRSSRIWSGARPLGRIRDLLRFVPRSLDRPAIIVTPAKAGSRFFLVLHRLRDSRLRGNDD